MKTKGANITRLLELFLGPERTLTILHFLHRWGVLLWLAPLALAAFVYLAIVRAEGDHVFEAYEMGIVKSSISTPSDSGRHTISFVIELPNRDVVQVTTQNLQWAMSVVKTACIEVRRYVDTDKRKWDLASPHYCQVD